MQEKQSSAPFDTPLRKWHNYTSSIGKSLLLDVLARGRRRDLPIRPPMSMERRCAARECELGAACREARSVEDMRKYKKNCGSHGRRRDLPIRPRMSRERRWAARECELGAACREARSVEDMRKYKQNCGSRGRRRSLPTRPPMSRKRRWAPRDCELGQHVERREASETCGSIRRTAARTREEKRPSEV